MYINPFGLSGGNGNPYAALEQQIRQQLAEIEELGRRAVETFQGQQQVQQNQPQIPQPVQDISAAIEKNMMPDDLQYLAGNIYRLPEFFGSSDGRDILRMVIDGLKKSGESSGTTTTAAAAEPGTTT
ncbi:hypothetical protein [Yokenella regensburgei]|uniref:hypothetical protein n=1 Tax=Yokenella regensburgei TaxID=158877 RepID=UPI0031DE4A26